MTQEVIVVGEGSCEGISVAVIRKLKTGKSARAKRRAQGRAKGNKNLSKAQRKKINSLK